MKRRHIILVVVMLLTGTAISGLAIPRMSDEPKTSSSGEQWEYLIVGGGGNVNLTPTENTSLRKEPGPFGREDFPLEGNLDKLGKNGWELVTVTESPRLGPTFIFKRRK